jgi:hypothetical protein
MPTLLVHYGELSDRPLEKKFVTIPVTPRVRNKLRTIVKGRKVLGKTATYSSVIEEALEKSLSKSEGRWTL